MKRKISSTYLLFICKTMVTKCNSTCGERKRQENKWLPSMKELGLYKPVFPIIL